MTRLPGVPFIAALVVAAACAVSGCWLQRGSPAGAGGNGEGLVVEAGSAHGAMAWKSGRGVVILDQLDWSGRYLEAVGLKLERRDGAVRLPHEDPERTAEALAGAVLALRRRMAIIAENVANAETARMPGAAEAGAPPQPYRRKVLNIGALGALEVAADGSAFRRVYRPAHSEADKDGRVQLPNVYVEVEMADWRSSAREYESLRGALGLVSTRYAAPPAELLPVPVPPPAYEEKPAIPVPAPAAPEAKPVLPTPSPVPPKAP